MCLNRLLDVIGIALFQLVGFQRFVRKATRRGAVFDAAGFRKRSNAIHVVFQIREGGVGGPQVKIGPLLGECFRL